MPKTGKARVLTSSECLRLMKEKEEKKIQVAYEKEKRKQEREQKKKEEGEQKKKAAERVHKVAEKEAEKARKEQDKAERAKMKARVEQEKAVKAGKKRSLITSGQGNSSRQKRKRKSDMESSINTDECCVCLGTYLVDLDTDRDWLQCCCGRWIHEDCVDIDDTDNSSGRLCPLC